MESRMRAWSGRCSICRNLATGDMCEVCRAPNRDRSLVAVVEEPLDVVAIEKTGHYHGLYHVLGGTISPIDGIGPENLEIESFGYELHQGWRRSRKSFPGNQSQHRGARPRPCLFAGVSATVVLASRDWLEDCQWAAIWSMLIRSLWAVPWRVAKLFNHEII